MRVGIAVVFTLVSSATAQAETLLYGSRAGMEVTVVKKMGLGTSQAKIITKHTRENAIAYCRDYVLKVTPDCIAGELEVKLAPTITANCTTGSFTTLNGQAYRFRGPNPTYLASNEGPEYLIVEKGTVEPLSASMVSGYYIALSQFSALCPKGVLGSGE